MDNVTERCGHCQKFRGTTLPIQSIGGLLLGMLHGLPKQVCAIDRKVSSKLDRIVDTTYTFGYDAS